MKVIKKNETQKDKSCQMQFCYDRVTVRNEVDSPEYLTFLNVTRQIYLKTIVFQN
jgi:hypothetical protein